MALEKLERLRDVVRVDRRLAVALVRLLESSDAWPRERCLLTLARIGAPKEALDAVVRLLSNRTARVRDYACEAIGRSGLPQAAVHLRRALKDRDEQVRFSALEGLANSKAFSGLSLERHLRDRSSLVRLAAVRALFEAYRCKRVRYEAVIKIIQRHLEVERADTVRCDCFELLYCVRGDRRALDQLTRLADSPSPLVRWRAYETLSGVADHTNWRQVLDTFAKALAVEKSRASRRLVLSLRGELRSRFQGCMVAMMS